jgi:Rrf2 family protein
MRYTPRLAGTGAAALIGAERIMLNSSADYALRAVLYMARQAPDRSCSAGAIAAALGVPRNYIGKVLNTLAHAGVLTSVRGPRGGFRLARPPSRLSLREVVEPFQQQLTDRRVCLLGDRPCDARQPCDVHIRWQSMTGPVNEFFHETTIALLLQPWKESA